MKTTKKILSMLLAFAVICTLLAACGADTPADTVTASNGGEGNNLDAAVDTPDTSDSPDGSDAQIDRNPYTGPPAIENAVVVSATKHNDSDRIGFSCSAIIEGYPGGYTPFTFSVPTSLVEGEYDPEKPEDLTGAIVYIEFDGAFMESDPLQIGGVTKVEITGERADDDTLNECKSGFVIENCIEETMYICEGWIVKAEPASDGSGNAVIYAMAQLGTCGVKDYVKLGFPAEKICDEQGNTVDVNSIAPGTCFVFAYDGSITSASEDKAIFEINWTDMDYVTIGSENVGYTAEQYAEFYAYFEIDK